METITSDILLNQVESIKKTSALEQEITHFYDEATEDYSFWSKDLNMHFGYFKLFRTNPFRRDSMLNELNRQVLIATSLPTEKAHMIDLGCGMGGTMRYFLKHHKQLKTVGVTLSDFQVEEGNKLLKGKKGYILKENFENTSLDSNSADGVVAMESLCHSGHSYRALKEGHRLLKEGGKLVITDAFLKTSPDKLCLGSSYSYKQLCKGWSLDGLGQIDRVVKDLKTMGFSKVEVKDISLRVAPSVFHVPFAIGGFLLKKLINRKTVKPQSWNNLKASFYALISGLHMHHFGYYIITATK